MGWAWTILGDVVELNPRTDASSLPDQTLVSFVPMSAVEAETGHIDVTETRQLGDIRGSSYTLFREGDVLFAKITPSMENGKSAVARRLTSGLGFGSTEFHVLRPMAGIEASFIQNYIVQKSFRRSARGHMKGTAGQLRVPTDYLKEVPLPLAPTQEQRRIVAAIEEQTSRLNAGVSALERARANLERYRTAVLKGAVEGRLTEAWRRDNPDVEPASDLLERILEERRDRWEEEQLVAYAQNGKKPPKNWRSKYQEPTGPETENLPELPEGWCWASLPQIGRFDRGRSRHRPRNAPHLYGGSYPFIQTGDVRQADTFIRDYKQTYSEAGLQQSKLWPAGTLCITIAANIAETAILSFDACFPDSVVGFLASSEHISTRFVEIYLRTIQARLEAYAPATAQKNINIETLKQVAVALPPTAEQLHIVAEVDRRMSVVTHVETEVEDELKRAAGLRQSILKRAFEGKLVPQDPNDEPAITLLMRVRVEKSRREQEARLAQRSRRKKPQRRQEGQDMKSRKQRRPLQEVLFEADEPLKPEELFDKAGFEPESTDDFPESVEDFYVELREEVRNKRIEELRLNEVDVQLRVVEE